MVSNFLNNPIDIPERMHIALEIDVPQRIFTVPVVESIETVSKIPQ